VPVCLCACVSLSVSVCLKLLIQTHISIVFYSVTGIRILVSPILLIFLPTSPQCDANGLPRLDRNTIKITDFGLARRFTHTTHMSLTAGTYQWMVCLPVCMFCMCVCLPACLSVYVCNTFTHAHLSHAAPPITPPIKSTPLPTHRHLRSFAITYFPNEAMFGRLVWCCGSC
jgi:hypothetical protein